MDPENTYNVVRTCGNCNTRNTLTIDKGVKIAKVMETAKCSLCGCLIEEFKDED